MSRNAYKLKSYTYISWLKMTDQNYITISLPREFVEVMNKAIKGKGYASRAEYVKHVVRKDLEAMGVAP